MTPGIVDLWEVAGVACEDNCDGEVNGVPCQDIEDPPCYQMCND